MVRRILTVLTALALSACGPLYAGKPQKLRGMKTKPRPPEADVAVIPWNDKCEAKFFLDGSKVRPEPREAAPLFDTGRTALENADRSEDPKARGNLMVEAMRKLNNALVKDPYNAEITVTLAIANAKVLRKGCALALLKRLVDLEKHPTYRSAAQRMIGFVQSEDAFAGFRSEADSAVGR